MCVRVRVCVLINMSSGADITDTWARHGSARGHTHSRVGWLEEDAAEDWIEFDWDAININIDGRAN